MCIYIYNKCNSYLKGSIMYLFKCNMTYLEETIPPVDDRPGVCSRFQTVFRGGCCCLCGAGLPKASIPNCRGQPESEEEAALGGVPPWRQKMK